MSTGTRPPIIVPCPPDRYEAMTPRDWVLLWIEKDGKDSTLLGKNLLVDDIARILLGGQVTAHTVRWPNGDEEDRFSVSGSDGYESFVEEFKVGEDGLDTYAWLGSEDLEEALQRKQAAEAADAESSANERKNSAKVQDTPGALESPQPRAVAPSDRNRREVTMKHPLIGVLVATTLFLVSFLAEAGTFTLQQSVDFLKPADVQELHAKAAEWPFDMTLLATDSPNLTTLEDRAHAAVSGPNVVVLAIDPIHHRVVTRFGMTTNVKPGDFDAVTKSGNAHFRANEPVAGVIAVAQSAKASALAKTAITGAPEPVIIEGALSTGAWTAIVLLVSGFAGLAFWLIRRNRKDQEAFQSVLDQSREEAAEMRARNVEHMVLPREDVVHPSASVAKAHPAYPPPTPKVQPAYYPPAPKAKPARTNLPSGSHAVPRAASTPHTPDPVHVHHHHGGSHDLATGILLGEALSRPRERVIEVPSYSPPEPVHHAPSSYGGSASSSSSGGSSSSYSGSSSSYGSSGSSYDSGGSSSSYGGSSSSYSSSDSGGGSSDGGGGGGGGGD